MQSGKKAPSSISSKLQTLPGQAQSEHADNEGEPSTQSQPVGSVADELSKLAKLRDQGVITEAEFVQIKANLINRAQRQVMKFKDTT
jgi:hypothetical protein